MTSRRKLSGAEALTAVLEAHDTSFVFGLCGHTVVAVLDALSRSTIRFVPVHHEQMATHAADAHARLTGRAGVALVHLGPGLTNAITGFANASLDSTPMVLISGNVQSYYFGRHAHMESLSRTDGDQASCVAPWAKRVFKVERPEALVQALDHAFLVAESGRPGPVLVDVAMDVFSREVEIADPYLPPEPASPAAPSPQALKRVRAELARAERPVVYVGGGVIRSRGSAPLNELIETLGCPVAYTVMGKGALSDEHPANLGLTGHWGTPAANSACRDADLVLAIGTDFHELDTSSWEDGITFSFPRTRLVHAYDEPADIGRTYRADVPVQADARVFIEGLNALLKTDPLGRPFDVSEPLIRSRAEFVRSYEEHQLSDQFPMRPERVLSDLRKALPRDGVVVADTGWNKNGVGQQFPLYEPSTLLAPGGFATMGFGPSAALGAALSAPDRTVVALVGDGAFLTNISVVQTAVEERIPVVWAVMNNGTYATISGMQRRYFGNDYGSTFDSSSTDLAAVARALGARGVRVESADELVNALQQAFSLRTPCLIDIPTTSDAVPVTGAWDIKTLFGRDR